MRLVATQIKKNKLPFLEDTLRCKINIYGPRRHVYLCRLYNIYAVCENIKKLINKKKSFDVTCESHRSKHNFFVGF